MGHAYLVADGHDEAEILGVMASGDDELMRSLLEIHQEQRTRARRPRSGAVIGAGADGPVQPSLSVN